RSVRSRKPGGRMATSPRSEVIQYLAVCCTCATRGSQLMENRRNGKCATGGRPLSASPTFRDDLDALRAVVEGTACGTGQEFFRSLVRHLAEAIDVHYAVAAEFPKAPPHVRTLAFWERDRVADNFE